MLGVYTRLGMLTAGDATGGSTPTNVDSALGGSGGDWGMGRWRPWALCRWWTRPHSTRRHRRRSTPTPWPGSRTRRARWPIRGAQETRTTTAGSRYGTGSTSPLRPEALGSWSCRSCRSGAIYELYTTVYIL